jgi:hypothetical protein
LVSLGGANPSPSSSESDELPTQPWRSIIALAPKRQRREAVMPVGNLTDQWFFLCGVDVLADEEAGGVVALGDSLTDGNISTIDAFCRWPDQLAKRLAQRGGRPIGVTNNGLGGNRILHGG